MEILNNIYHQLFETPLGVVVLFAAAILISLIVAAILEHRTRKVFKNHPVQEEDDED